MSSTSSSAGEEPRWRSTTPTGPFWDAVARHGLPFTRRDRLAEIMDSGRITNRSHYELAKDEIVAAAQTGRLTEAEAMRLGA